MVPERPSLEIASAVNRVFMTALSCSVVRPGDVFGGTAQRRRTTRKIITITIRRPTAPPPIQMPSARIGEKNDNIVFLSLFDDNLFAISFGYVTPWAGL